jgi:hypothetical protein
MWQELLFKVFFIRKCIKIIFFYFLKIYFNISISNDAKTQKDYFEVHKNIKKINFF